MDTLYLLNRFVWLFTMGACFAITLISIQHPFQDGMVIRRSRVFMIPLSVFMMNALHLTPAFSIEEVSWVGESLLVLSLWAVHWKGAVFLERLFLPFLVMPVTSIVLMRLIHEYGVDFVKNVQQPHYFWTVLIPFIGLYLVNRHQLGHIKLLFYGGIMLILSYGVQFFGRSLYMPEVSLVLKATAYILWIIHVSNVAREETVSCRHELSEAKRRMEKTAFYAARKRESELNRTHQNILENAKKDGLTGAFNRISIMDMIEERLKRQPDQPFSILMFDIDKFKSINDQYGHVVGDLALKQLASTAENVIRGEDRLGRYGGDEFIILLPTLNLPEAKIVAERLRERIQEQADPVFSISIGVAVYPKDGTSVVKLIEKADLGLYKSKGKGGNSVSHTDVF